MTDRGSGNSIENLRDTIEELTLDIGRILHANTSTLLMVSQTLIATIETLTSRSISPSDINVDEIESDVVNVARRLAGALEKMGEAGTQSRREEALSSSDWEVLARQAQLYRDFESVIEVQEMRFPALRKSAHEVLMLCKAIEPGHLPREKVRSVMRFAGELERLTCLIDTLTTRAAVLQMDVSLRALRDFITADLREPEQAERIDIQEVVRDVIAQLAEFAEASHVGLEVQHHPESTYVVGDRREITRALSNLLHNAIKYSWHRDRTKAPWVGIRFGVNGERVYAEFETWGVAITREELEEGALFRIGYRGKWSTDRGRLGTGIGLTDAMRVARAHGGTVEVTSRPAHAYGQDESDPEYYRQPFITVARITFNEKGTQAG